MFLFFLGLGGFEPPTLRLSGVYSNQLSYKPWYNSNADFIPLEWKDSNLWFPVPKTDALPLGHTPPHRWVIYDFIYPMVLAY